MFTWVHLEGKALINFFARLEWTVPILALVATLWVGWNTSYANKIQTLPNLHLRSGADANGKPYCGTQEQGIVVGTQTLCLENNGLGPGRIVGFDVIINGRFFDTRHALDWKALGQPLSDIGIELPLVMTTTLPPKNVAIKAGEAIQLARFKPRAVVDKRPDLAKTLDDGKLDIGVCYCNYYSDCLFESIRAGASQFKQIEQSCQNSSEYKRFNWWAPIDRSLVEGNDGPPR